MFFRKNIYKIENEEESQEKRTAEKQRIIRVVCKPGYNLFFCDMQVNTQGVQFG